MCYNLSIFSDFNALIRWFGWGLNPYLPIPRGLIPLNTFGMSYARNHSIIVYLTLLILGGYLKESLRNLD